MKVKHFERIDEYDVFGWVSDLSADPEDTKEAVLAKYPGIDLVMLEPNEVNRLFAENVVYSKPGPNAEWIEDDAAAALVALAKTCGEYEKLSADGTAKIPDYRGTEYWQNQGGKWKKIKIEKLGVALPAGTILDNDLTHDQRDEIAVQRENERIAALSPTEKDNEKQNRIKAALHGAAIKKQEADIEAEISGEPSAFDAAAWFQEQKAEIEAKYA
jgi:phage gpG-like protein